MAEFTMRIKGLEQLRANFRKSPTLIFNEMNKAIRKSGLMATVSAKSVTPVLTGALRGSIRPRFQPLMAIIQPHKDYAIFVHDGTRHMRPRPFMKWGLERSKASIENVFNKAIKNITKKLSNI